MVDANACKQSQLTQKSHYPSQQNPNPALKNTSSTLNPQLLIALQNPLEHTQLSTC